MTEDDNLLEDPSFDDLVPEYEHCWDYRTSDGQKVDRSKFSKEALAQLRVPLRSSRNFQNLSQRTND
jgi:hypothetical protein